MALWERLTGIGLTEANRNTFISPHFFFSVMQEFALGQMTGPQATAAFDPALTAGEQTEALAVRDKILESDSANDNALRKLKALEMENVLHIAYRQKAPYTTIAAVKSRLGIS